MTPPPRVEILRFLRPRYLIDAGELFWSSDTKARVINDSVDPVSQTATPLHSPALTAIIGSLLVSSFSLSQGLSLSLSHVRQHFSCGDEDLDVLILGDEIDDGGGEYLH